MNIAELFARIGLKTDEDKAKSFHRAMATVKVGLIATTAVATGTALAIRKITSEAMAGAVAFKQFETETGASAQELQKWQAVAEQTNQSAESVTSAIKSIVSNQEKIKLGQGDISGFQILGIDPRQDPFKILEELRTKSKDLSDGMKKNILTQIGVGAGMLQTLNLTRKEFDEMADRAWIISPQAIETLNQTKSAVDLAARSINYMKTQIAVGLSPQTKMITKDFQKWMKVNEKGIIEGFKKGFKFVTMFVKAVYNAGSVINGAISSTDGLGRSIKRFLGLFIALNAILLVSPIGLITAGIILLVAVLDDLSTYSKGGKSLFGEMMEDFPELEKTVFKSFKTIKDVFSLMKAFSSGDFKTIDTITKEWGSVGEAISGTYKTIKNIIDLLEAIRIGDEGSIDNLTGDWTFLSELIKGIIENIEKFKTLLDDLGVYEKTKPGEMSRADKNIANLKKEGINLGIPKILTDLYKKFGGGGDTTQNNNINVNVSGSTHPVATGDATAKAIQREINAASAQLSRNQ